MGGYMHPEWDDYFDYCDQALDDEPESEQYTVDEELAWLVMVDEWEQR